MSIVVHLLLIFQLLRHIDSELCPVLISLLIGISNLFVYCYYGKMATDSFCSMSDSLYEANWHDMPMELQRYIILMIANSQKAIHYHGFRMASLDLVTFSKVRFVFISRIVHQQ